MHELKFLVTEESARLARWLRLMGYDAATAGATPLPALYRRAYNEARIVVTRNGRVGTSRLFRVVQLNNQRLEDQLKQVMKELHLSVEPDKAFSRCDVCNVTVDPVEKSLIKDRVPPYVFQTQPAFHQCPSCRRIYWAATHYQRTCALFEKLKP